MARSKNFKSMLCAGVVGMLAIGSGAASAGFDQDVMPEVIFGSGNANGAFTTDQHKGVEIGLRAKQRFPKANIFNSNGDGTYSFVTGSGTGNGPPTSQYPIWNFEWSINTDYKGSSGDKLDDYTYELGLDGDRGIETSFLTWDPVHLGPNACADHSLGDNATGNGDGVEHALVPVIPNLPCINYNANLASFNVAQNSWRYGFFSWGPLIFFNPDDVGVYDIYLLARNSKGKVVAKSSIRVLVGLTNGLPAKKNDCKNGGWATFDSLFASEEDCKDFVKNNGKDGHGHGND